MCSFENKKIKKIKKSIIDLFLILFYVSIIIIIINIYYCKEML